MKKLLAFVSVLLVVILMNSMILPAAAAAVEAGELTEPTEQTEYEDYQVPDENEYPQAEESQSLVDDNRIILIDSYEQLLLIGSGKTFGSGANAAAYSSDGAYRLTGDIALPRHTRWSLPEGFAGRIIPTPTENQPLYDNATDTIYIYNPYQLAVMAMEDADSQPLLTGDADAHTFGMGQPVYGDEDGCVPLTYSGDHNYVISTAFDSAITEAPVSVRRKSTELAATGSSTPYSDGRDFAGQVTKAIDGVTYILIGNEDQLRAIGSDAQVLSPVYELDLSGTHYVVDTNNGTQGLLYGGDADLLQTQNGVKNYTFQSIDNTNSYTGHRRYYAGVNQSTGEVYTDATHVTSDKDSLTQASWRTGETYSISSNYIIFRDIDLGGQADPWTPLMFTGAMYGAKTSNGEALWNGSTITDSTAITATATANRPVISGVYVNQNTDLVVNKYIGIGFFATITNNTSADSSGLASSGTAIVKNIELHDVHVENNTTRAVADTTLVSELLGGVGTGVGLLLKGLIFLLSFGQVEPDLETMLGNLLNARTQDPTIFATGAFAGRIYGDVLVEDCLVSGTVSVSNVNDRTGGFVGYTEGAARYSALSGILGGLANGLASLLNLVPAVGLGDLITILLGQNGALNVGNLLVRGYYNPQIIDCEVNGLTGNIGNTQTSGQTVTATASYIGGFVGQQIGTWITDCRVVDSDYHVYAKNYVGGFSGLSRDAEIKGTLDTGLGINLAETLLSLQPQSTLVDCTISGCEYQVSGENCLGGFVGAMANSYAVDCTINCPDDPLTVSGSNYIGGFAGYMTAGWEASLGKDEDNSQNLVGTLTTLVKQLLQSDPAVGQKLLTLQGATPSAAIGCQIYSEALSVQADDSYAGGLVGRGEGAYITSSDQEAFDTLASWNAPTLKAAPADRLTVISGLDAVSAENDYAGGVAGYITSVAFQGLLNETLGLGNFIDFLAKDITVTGVSGGYTVETGNNDAGGGFGIAVGGEIENVKLNQLQRVQADNRAAGFVAVAGPGDLAGSTGGITVNLLGLNYILSAKNLLSLGELVEVTITDSDVTGIDGGYTVEAVGTGAANDVTEYKASGFIADSNSTKITNSHAYKLLSVTATDLKGYAGGFIGTSTTGGLADAAGQDATEVKRLLQADGLLSAIEYLIPEYTNCTVNFVDGGTVDADIAGGFVADMESGTVDNSTIASVDDSVNPKWTHSMKELYDPDAVNATGDLNKQFAVINIDYVHGRTYAGGFGGKLRSGALADAGGGISILGDSGLGLNIGIDDLVNVMNAYVPVVTHAGVYSENGYTVAANTIRTDDPDSGSAGGFAGYMSGAQISYCDVYKLKHTEVTPPDDLEAVAAPSYFDSAQSTYAVTGGHYAGGYVGKMDVGSAASLGSGLKILGNTIQLTNLLKALNVVVSTIEHSDVQGAGGGFSVISDGTDPDDGKVGMSGGYAGGIFGGHIQNSHCKNFYYIIGQEAAGGYVGNMEPGNVANLLDDASILGRLVDADEAIASLVEDFVPTIRNSTTSCVPCGGAVRAHSPSDASRQRGCAGGYCGHNEGGHIWGLNSNTWKDQNDGQVGNNNYGHNTEGNYTGEQHICTAWRIRSVYGYEYAGGFTGYMESADTANTGSIHLLGGLISADNLLGALSMVYPTEESTAVYGPLRNLDKDTWNLWVEFIGKNGGYGGELAREGTVSTQAQLDAKLSKYIYGCNVVAGRSAHETTLITEGGNAGGYVGYMVTGVITNGQSYDMKLIRAMRSAGGYAGRMQTGAAAEFGSVNLLGLNLDIGDLVKTAQVFVPTVKSGSVHGWQSGMTVTCTGTDFIHKCGYAGGYVGSAYGAQIWGDKNVGNTAGTGCNVTNLRYVRGRNAAGGYVGLATAASVADVNTNASKGFLQRLLNSLISSPGDLASVLKATATTIRDAEVNPDDPDFGFIVEGLSGTPPRVAGGFAGSLEATVINDLSHPYSVTVNGLRRVDGLYYAGGFVGLADVGSVASVSNSGQDSTNILSLINAGSVDLLDVFRTYIYDSDVHGVADGFTVHAYSEDSEGLLSEVRYTGCAGGFAGGMMNGTIKRCDVTNLNTVSGVNYIGGFIGHAGKNGIVDVDDAQVVGPLAGLTAGVLDIFGTVIDDCDVSGYSPGIVVTSTGGSEPIAGGYAGYADVSQIKNSNLTNLKQVYSDEIAGGFVGKTNMKYLVEAEVDSALVQIVLGILNTLLKILQVHRLEDLDLINTDSWLNHSQITNLLGLKLLSEGDLLYVNLLGLRVGVSLVHPDPENNSTGTALITIGDSSVELPYNEDGIDLNAQNAEVVVNLIKGNRTKVEKCTVHGISSGYDVYGGGAGNDQDGSNSNGYAGGFVGYNDEGKFTDNVMEYCDVVRGTAHKVGPFSGTTHLKSVYSFNTLQSIEAVSGEENRYSVYRQADPALAYALTGAGQQIGSTAAQDTGTTVTYNRYDVIHLASPLSPDGVDGDYHTGYDKWEGAVIASDASGADAVPIEVYASSAKAVLMLDRPTNPNEKSLIPEPGESQDPCDLISITIQKVWDDYDNFDGTRPQSIRIRLIQWQTNAQGERISGTDAVYRDLSVIPDAHPVDGWFTLTAQDHALSDSATWRRVIEGLPVSTVINGATVYYAYTVEEEAIPGYETDIAYSSDGFTATVRNTHRPILPSTGGFGDWIYILCGAFFVIIGLTVFGRRKTAPQMAQRTFRPPQGAPRGQPRGRPRGQPRGHPRE